MKFLFDENIPYRIVKKLKLSLPNFIHVSQTSLRYASADRKIWAYAKAYDYVIVTFDEDFKELSQGILEIFCFSPFPYCARSPITSSLFTNCCSLIILLRQ